MSEEYHNEDQKLFRLKRVAWTPEECLSMHSILLKKGYIVNCVDRIGADGKWHDAWRVQRKDIGRLIEQLFRQRIIVEVQAEGQGMAAINFVYNYRAETIIAAIKKFQKNR